MELVEGGRLTDLIRKRFKKEFKKTKKLKRLKGDN
jgi:hypothetical protein